MEHKTWNKIYLNFNKQCLDLFHVPCFMFHDIYSLTKKMLE